MFSSLGSPGWECSQNNSLCLLFCLFVSFTANYLLIQNVTPEATPTSPYLNYEQLPLANTSSFLPKCRCTPKTTSSPPPTFFIILGAEPSPPHIGTHAEQVSYHRAASSTPSLLGFQTGSH